MYLFANLLNCKNVFTKLCKFAEKSLVMLQLQCTSAETRKEVAMKDILQELEERRDAARLGGGQKRIDAQHSKGKLT